MSEPVTGSSVADYLRRRGLLATADGAEALATAVRRSAAAPADALRAAVDAVRARLAKAPAPAVSAAVVAAALAEGGRGDVDMLAESVAVVSAFDTPRFRLDPARRVYRRAPGAAGAAGGSAAGGAGPPPAPFPLHGEAAARTALHAERLALAEDRTLRAPYFAPPPPGSRASYLALQRVDDMRPAPREGARAAGGPGGGGGGAGGGAQPISFGLLTQPEDGVWALEDAGGKAVALDLTRARCANGVFTETAVVLAEGEYDPDGYAPGFEPPPRAPGGGGGGAGAGSAGGGVAATAAPTFLTDGRLPGVLRVAELSHPPLEARAATLDAMGVPDIFGAAHTPAEAARLEALVADPRVGGGGMLAVLSDVHLDVPETLAGLRGLLGGFDSAGAGGAGAPALVVLMGNFSSRPMGASAGDRAAYAAGFRALGDVLEEFPAVSARTHYVLVPGPTDLGSAPVLPRAPLPVTFARGVLGRRAAPRVTLTSNPARVRYFSREIVLFRHDVTARLRRRAALPPNVASAADAVAGGGAGGEGEGEGEGGGGAGAGGGAGGDDDWPATRHTAHTLLSQAHLLPLPLAAQALHWEYDFALRLHPAPHALVVAESLPQYEHVVGPAAAGEGACVVFNPGPFSPPPHDFAVLLPAPNAVQMSAVGELAAHRGGGADAGDDGEDGGERSAAAADAAAAAWLEAEAAELARAGAAPPGAAGEAAAAAAAAAARGGAPAPAPARAPTVLSDGSVLGAGDPYAREGGDAIPRDDDEEGEGEGEAGGAPREDGAEDADDGVGGAADGHA